MVKIKPGDVFSDSSVYRVEATDADNGDKGDIRYSLSKVCVDRDDEQTVLVFTSRNTYLGSIICSSSPVTAVSLRGRPISAARQGLSISGPRRTLSTSKIDQIVTLLTRKLTRLIVE